VDGASEDRESWVRRAVLVLLVVVGLVTAVYAVGETRSGTSRTTATDDVPIEVVTDFVPSDGPSNGPLRLDDVLVVGRE
jgi:hypothetical protein